MNNYLCANRHHFRAPSPRCPSPDCNAEVRQTAVHPLSGSAPPFEKLPRLAGAPAPAAPEKGSEKHSCRWWSYEGDSRVRWNDDTADRDRVDATCSCGWDSATGRSPEVVGEPLTAIRKLVKAHKAG